MNILYADIYEFAKRLKPDLFDIAIMDTWQLTGEHAWETEVVPLRRLMSGKVGQLFCWNEDEMTGQILFGGYRKMLVDPQEKTFSRSQFVLGSRIRQMDVPVPDFDMSDFNSIMLAEKSMMESEEACALLNRYVMDAGSPEWEDEFGELWDQYQGEA